MGADGGLTWMKIRSPEYNERIMQLLNPLSIIENQFRDEDYDHLNDLYKENCLISRYGTDLQYDGLEELNYILDVIEDTDSNTFEFIALDLATRPMWQLNSFSLNTLENVIMRSCSWMFWSDLNYNTNYCFDLSKRNLISDQKRTEEMIKGIESLGILKDMSISSWAEELKKMLYWKQVGSIETWT